MRAENFSWSDGIRLVVNEQEFDLHNCFDFRSFDYNVANRTASLKWCRGSGEWIDRNLAAGVRIEFFDVDYLKIRPRDPELPFTEDDCLASFGYDCDEDWTNGQFWMDGPADPTWRWSFLFQSGAEIVIGGVRAVVSVD